MDTLPVFISRKGDRVKKDRGFIRSISKRRKRIISRRRQTFRCRKRTSRKPKRDVERYRELDKQDAIAKQQVDYAEATLCCSTTTSRSCRSYGSCCTNQCALCYDRCPVRWNHRDLTSTPRRFCNARTNLAQYDFFRMIRWRSISLLTRVRSITSLNCWRKAIRVKGFHFPAFFQKRTLILKTVRSVSSIVQ